MSYKNNVLEIQWSITCMILLYHDKQTLHAYLYYYMKYIFKIYFFYLCYRQIFTMKEEVLIFFGLFIGLSLAGKKYNVLFYHRFLEGWPTDCFWADAPYTQGEQLTENLIFFNMVQEVMLPLVAPSCVNVFLGFFNENRKLLCL